MAPGDDLFNDDRPPPTRGEAAAGCATGIFIYAVIWLVAWWLR